jgi:outer membrane protein assembly factor BamB
MTAELRFAASRGRVSLAIVARFAALLILGVALCGAAAAGPRDWPQFGRSPRHLNVNPKENTFTPQNVSRLRVEWAGHFGDNTSTEGGAVLAGPLAYVADFDGRLSAFSIDGCGQTSCEPLWQGQMRNNATSTPAVSDGKVFIASADRFLHVFDAAGCGASRCQALWRGRLRDASLDSSVAVADGVAYVGNFGGHLLAFDAAGCGASVCEPLWTGLSGPNEEMNSSPAVGAGHVFVASTISTAADRTGRLLAYPAAGCGASECAPIWSADIGGPAGFTTSPVVAADMVFAGSSRRFGGPNGPDHLFAFRASGCGKAVCQPIASFDAGPDGIDSTPAVSDGMLFASTQASPDLNTVGVVAAFDIQACTTRLCKPMWTGVNFTEGFMSSPVVAGDVVFVGKGPADFVDSGVFAYDRRGCGGRATCRALSLVLPSPWMFYLGSPLAVAGGRIAFVSNDNVEGRSNMYIMTLP